MKEERLSKILEIIKNEKFVTTKRLKKLLNASEATIRRDLNELKRRGLIQRVFGGGLINEIVDVELSFNEKMKINIKEKKSIAEFASNLVNDGERIFLESGTTVIHMIKYLKNKSELYIVTNCLNVATKVLNLPNINLLLIGGELREKTYNLIGPITEKTISEINVDKTFMGVDGIDLEHGLTSYNLYEAHVMSILIKNSKEVYVLADHTKFGKFAHFKIAPLNKITAVITDSLIDEKYIKLFVDAGITLHMAAIKESL